MSDDIEMVAKAIADGDPGWGKHVHTALRVLQAQIARATRARMEVGMVMEATGTCPVDGAPDRYTITVSFPPGRTCMVEELAEAVEKLLARPILQEDFTQNLAAHLGASVETDCRHANGVRLICCVVHEAGEAGP